MDFTGIEHPFRVNNSMSDRGTTDFNGSSKVEINTRRLGLSDEFNNDVAELSHRIFHEKRHVYQNIQRSLGFGENGFAPLELYSKDVAEGRWNTRNATQAQIYDQLKNKYDYNVARDGRFPNNVSEEDIDYGMMVSINQANYIPGGAEYCHQHGRKGQGGESDRFLCLSDEAHYLSRDIGGVRIPVQCRGGRTAAKQRPSGQACRCHCGRLPGCAE